MATETRRSGWCIFSTRPYLVCLVCGFRPAHFPPLLSGSLTSVEDLQNTLLYSTGLNPYFKITRLHAKYIHVYILDNGLFTCDDLDKLKVGATITQPLTFCRHISLVFNKLYVHKLLEYIVI